MSAPCPPAPTIADIRAAAVRLEGAAVRTPLLESTLLNHIAGRRVLIKAEPLQRTGSFKFRGAWSYLSTLDKAALDVGIVAFSSGNHAQGAALAARMLNAPAVIIMPSDAPKLKLANTRAYGAEVLLYERGVESREEIGERLTGERGMRLVRPYDEPLVIAGQGTVGLEIAAQARAAGVESADVLIPCGGGGLTAGIALALEAEAPGLRARPAEPVGFDDVARSLAAGERLSNPAETGSICDAILTPTPGEITFPVLKRLCGPGLVVTDAQALHAMALAWSHLKLVMEPGGAAALATALFRPDQIVGDAVIVIASGGNADPALYARALSEYGTG